VAAAAWRWLGGGGSLVVARQLCQRGVVAAWRGGSGCVVAAVTAAC
jgi:hypothetical protein